MGEPHETTVILIEEMRAVRRAVNRLTIVVFLCAVGIVVALYSPRLAMATVFYLGTAAVLIVALIVVNVLVDRGLRRLKRRE